ncbi:hypothetical protein ACLKA6_009234 [Drosophila palustris]
MQMTLDLDHNTFSAYTASRANNVTTRPGCQNPNKPETTTTTTTTTFTSMSTSMSMSMSTSTSALQFFILSRARPEQSRAERQNPDKPLGQASSFITSALLQLQCPLRPVLFCPCTQTSLWPCSCFWSCFCSCSCTMVANACNRRLFIIQAHALRPSVGSSLLSGCPSFLPFHCQSQPQPRVSFRMMTLFLADAVSRRCQRSTFNIRRAVGLI